MICGCGVMGAARRLGRRVERRGGSSPLTRTDKIRRKLCLIVKDNSARCLHITLHRTIKWRGTNGLETLPSLSQARFCLVHQNQQSVHWLYEMYNVQV